MSDSCDHMDCSLPGSSVHGILQARILEWAAMPFFRGSSQARDQARNSSVSCTGRQVLYHYRHLGSPQSRGNTDLNITALNRISEYMKQKLVELKGERGKQLTEE